MQTTQLNVEELFALLPKLGFVIAVIFILKILFNGLKLWKYLTELKIKGGAIFFKLPLGYLQESNANGVNGDAFEHIKDLIQKEPKTRLVASNTMLKPQLWLIDPLLIEEFVNHNYRYEKASILGLIKFQIGKGLAFSEGQMWKKHRKILSESFRFDFLASQIPKIVKTAKEVFNSRFEKTGGKNIDALTLFEKITGTLVFRIFFGEDLIKKEIDGLDPTEFAEELVVLLLEVSFSIENSLFGVPFVRAGILKRDKKLMQDMDKLNKFCLAIIEDKRQRLKDNPKLYEENFDLLTLLLKLETQESSDSDGKFTDEEILQEFITFFLAGMDTTAHLLTMMVYHFQRSSSEVQKAIMQEASVVNEAGTHITTELLNLSENITAFMKETQRITPTAAYLFFRQATKDHYIRDIRIPKGAHITASILANCWNPEYFKNPKEFNHNRWIAGHQDFNENVAKNPFIFMPFSTGPRNCIGQHLAMMEARIIFSFFITEFEYKIPADYKLRMKMDLVYGPLDGIDLTLVRRKTSSSS